MKKFSEMTDQELEQSSLVVGKIVNTLTADIDKMEGELRDAKKELSKIEGQIVKRNIIKKLMGE